MRRHRSRSDWMAKRIVKVALAERSYDVIIGAGALTTLGERIAALRPGARTAVVTDRSVAGHWSRQTEAALKAAGLASVRDRRRRRRR